MWEPDRDGPRNRDELNRRGDVFVTGATLRSGFSLRAAIVSWRTTAEDIALLVEQVEEIGSSILRPAGKTRG